MKEIPDKLKKTLVNDAKKAYDDMIRAQFAFPKKKAKAKDQSNKDLKKTIPVKEKVEFINSILDFSLKKNIDDKTKERIFSVISTEIDKSSNIENEILERLQRIEAKIPGNENFPDKENPSIPIHRPKETKSFLSLFNNSNGLKYLTHKFNEGKRDYKSFIELCRQEFERAKDEFRNVPSTLVKRIEDFAFSENPTWYIRKGKEKLSPGSGWSEKSFVEWYNDKNNIHPGMNAKWNNEIIIPFKESIEVRAGNLVRIFEEAIELVFGESKDNFVINRNDDNLNLAEFYTDVDMFQHAITHIFLTIKDRAEKNLCFEININYRNTTIDGGDFKEVIITHVNSEATKDSKDPSFAKGDLKTIQNNLWSLCNYEIEAKFPDGLKKKIILTDNSEDYKKYVKYNKSVDIISVQGFTHILKFY